MTMKKKMLPVGIENYEKLRTSDFYYVDKTGLIKELLNNWSEVNLFTRPRRFGKSLNMSMLRCFFETGSNAKLFKGLEISKELELCNAYMGKFPIVSVSLKSIEGEDFEKACSILKGIIRAEAMRHSYLMSSEKLDEYEKGLLKPLLTGKMEGEILEQSIWILSRLLHRHYTQKVVILVDEYDVPLVKADTHGFITR